ncbi:MAG: hypothetical protein HY527_04355 [Betaproteobacteria bacterium]|nr:hypothetical protein [Betaproteobacteria bacterium]
MDGRRDQLTSRIVISKIGVTRLLVATVIVLHVLNVPALAFTYLWPPLDWTRAYIVFFSVSGEGKLPTFYSGMTLLAAAALLGLIAAHERSRGGRFHRHWAGLGIIFVLMALDEMFRVHEMTIRPLREIFGVTSGALSRAWVIPAMAFLAVMAVAYFRFLVALPARSRALFVIAGAIYVGGALGLEMVGGVYTSTYQRDLTYGVIATLEEVLEMAGMVLFLYGLMDHAEHHAAQNQIHIVA